MAADEVIVALFAHSKFCHDNNDTTTPRSSTHLKNVLCRFMGQQELLIGMRSVRLARSRLRSCNTQLNLEMVL
jgi:hypothetical protein